MQEEIKALNKKYLHLEKILDLIKVTSYQKVKILKSKDQNRQEIAKILKNVSNCDENSLKVDDNDEISTGGPEADKYELAREMNLVIS